MKRVYLLLALALSLLLPGCKDKTIDVFLPHGVSRIYGYGEFMDKCKSSSFVVSDKFKYFENLNLNILGDHHEVSNVSFYYFILRVSPSDAKGYKCYDVYVPEEYFYKFQIGDTIRQIK